MTVRPSPHIAELFDLRKPALRNVAAKFRHYEELFEIRKPALRNVDVKSRHFEMFDLRKTRFD
jgi:hypothetical protein